MLFWVEPDCSIHVTFWMENLAKEEDGPRPPHSVWLILFWTFLLSSPVLLCRSFLLEEKPSLSVSGVLSSPFLLPLLFFYLRPNVSFFSCSVKALTSRNLTISEDPSFYFLSDNHTVPSAWKIPTCSPAPKSFDLP